MIFSVTAPRGKFDVRDHCQTMKCKATAPGDAELLAAIYRVIAFGGRIATVEPDGNRHSFEFNGNGPGNSPASAPGPTSSSP